VPEAIAASNPAERVAALRVRGWLSHLLNTTTTHAAAAAAATQQALTGMCRVAHNAWSGRERSPVGLQAQSMHTQLSGLRDVHSLLLHVRHQPAAVLLFAGLGGEEVDLAGRVRLDVVDLLAAGAHEQLDGLGREDARGRSGRVRTEDGARPHAPLSLSQNAAEEASPAGGGEMARPGEMFGEGNQFWVCALRAALSRCCC